MTFHFSFAQDINSYKSLYIFFCLLIHSCSLFLSRVIEPKTHKAETKNKRRCIRYNITMNLFPRVYLFRLSWNLIVNQVLIRSFTLKIGKLSNKLKVNYDNIKTRKSHVVNNFVVVSIILHIKSEKFSNWFSQHVINIKKHKAYYKHKLLTLLRLCLCVTKKFKLVTGIIYIVNNNLICYAQ